MDTLAPLCIPAGIVYSPDFIFWLIYKHDNGYAKITKKLIIEDIRAISSEIEKFNLSGACGANSNVMKYTQAKTLLALTGQAKGARLLLKTPHEEYAFKFASDGRINSEKRDLVENEEKVRYALEIHNLLQEAYAEYTKIRDTVEWKTHSNEYRYNLITACMDDFKVLSSTLQNQNIT